VRPPGRCDKPFLSTDIFAAVRPGFDDAFALVLPEARAMTMDLFLARFSETLPAGVHTVRLLDQAGWHGKAALRAPDNITLLPLPPYAPELKPVGNVWHYLRENKLCARVWDSYEAILDACTAAWHFVVNDPDRIRSTGTREWARVRHEADWHYPEPFPETSSPAAPSSSWHSRRTGFGTVDQADTATRLPVSAVTGVPCCFSARLPVKRRSTT